MFGVYVFNAYYVMNEAGLPWHPSEINALKVQGWPTTVTFCTIIIVIIFSGTPNILFFPN
jgi:hypothetical protein